MSDGNSDRSGDGNVFWLEVFCSFAVLAGVALSYKFLDQNGGRAKEIHLLYGLIAFCLVKGTPEAVASYVFTGLTVTLVGLVYPIYRATKAACTPFDDDDKEWLQYWMLGGVLYMVTTWVDDVLADGRADELWFGALLFAFFWLYFPLTCGALLVYEKVTRPLLGPRLQPLQQQLSANILVIYQTLTNAAHLYLLWAFFLILPAGSKRAIAVAIGTFYPCISSITATATEDIEDDTYWLTYWAAYGLLFLFMDLLETWLGRMPGFYTIVVFATVYLMLPMFRGAEKVFRNVLVPLAGLREMLILRDAIRTKRQMMEKLDPERATLVRRTVARFFEGEGRGDSDPAVLNRELKQGWASLRLYKKSSGPSGESSGPGGAEIPFAADAYAPGSVPAYVPAAATVQATVCTPEAAYEAAAPGPATNPLYGKKTSPLSTVKAKMVWK